MADPPVFDSTFREGLVDLLHWRRDVRHFRRDPLPSGLLERLLDVASLAPSVGLSEPWRFVIVDDADRRAAVRACFERCNTDALAAQDDDTAAHYAKLKLAGLDAAPAHIAVYADGATDQGHGLGRHTMPATIDYSVVLAIHTLWLAARVEGIGLGWVSILDPGTLTDVLDVPLDWTFIGYLCLGYPSTDDDVPELQRTGWDARRAPSSRVFRR
jgi:5,6-dimethylbenzimidazole synthase